MTQKSALMDVFVKKCSRDDMDFRTVLPARETVLAYIVDLMALIRTLTSVPETFEALALKVLDCIPKAYRRVDIVADCYTPHSIKSVERNRRGMAPKVKVQSPKSKLPRDFKVFLANGENKTRMIELIRDVLVSNRKAILSDLGSECIVFSSFQDCIMVTRETVLQIPDLNSTQEEADTKVVLHANHVLTRNEDGVAIIRSHSGDIDIVVIALSHFVHDAERVILDSNTGRNRKAFKMSDIDLTSEQRRSLIGFHAFTGCDYNSAFFHRGKQVCWKLTEKKPKFVATFCKLGRTSTLEEDLSIELEEYVSHLYGIKGQNVNRARHAIFNAKLEKQKKICDISLLPPCKQALYLHSLRANFIAHQWRSSLEPESQLGEVFHNGWTEELEPKWLERVMPADIKELFIDLEFEEYLEDSDQSDNED